MEFKVIKRNGNAVVPDGMFKLCGMENAKLISMVQLNGGILLMPESVSTFELITLIDALTGQACEFLEAVAAECGPAEAEHRDITLDEVLREFKVAVPDWAREKAGITADTKLDCEASEDAGVIAVYPETFLARFQVHDEEAVLVSFVTVALHALPGNAFSIRRILRVCIITHHTFGDVYCFLGIQVIYIDIRVGRYGISQSRFFAAGISHLVRSRIPSQLFDTSPRFHRAFVRFSFQHIYDVGD